MTLIDEPIRLGLREQLETERDDLLAHAGLTAADLGDTDDPASYDAVAAALEAMAQTALADITSALARIDTDTYGSCLECGEAIPVERLEVMPSARLCVSCQQRNE